ncbi:MAG: DUF4038 domain-containing protein [Isosphaeraceae bacterium]
MKGSTMICRSTIFALVVPLLVASLRAAESPTAAAVEANRVIELTFTAGQERDDPFNAVDLDVEFETPRARKVRVPAFWSGGKTWKARYASPEVGTHRYRTSCSDPKDDGLNGRTGEVNVVAYRGDNPLYRHGPIRVAADRRHLEHLDGTPFFWLGDTWWMGLCDRLHWPDEFAALARDRKEKGFNVIQIVAGLYPDMPAFDPRGRNEAGFPWEEKYSRIRPEYFDRADERIGYLADQGIVPCVVMAWGYHLPWLGAEKMKKHVRYVMARWGALPVVWCMAGEVNLPYYLEKGFPRGGEPQTQAWEDVIRYARSLNGLGRPITVHPTGIEPLSGRLLYKDQALLDFDMLQTGHGQREVLRPTIHALRASRETRPVMPVLNGEVAYEALLGRIPAEIPRLMFWTNMLAGAAGHTYGANGIWQLNRREQPYGKSPHGGNYGTIPWDEAMNLPGSGQLGIAKKFLEQFPWQRLEPHQELATWAKAARPGPAWGDWIWYPEGDPRKHAPEAVRHFRRSFTLPEGKQVASATLRLTADDRLVAFLNGKELGSHAGWNSGREFLGLAATLRPGLNVLAVKGENAPGPKDANPAGLCGGLDVEFTDGTTMDIRTDASWRCSQTASGGWEGVNFEDREWKAAAVIARFGESPWGGSIGAEDEFLVPYTAAIPGELQITYSPLPRAVTIRGLAPNHRYEASVFNPVTGDRKGIETPPVEGSGHWTITPPPGIQVDWVLVLRAAR